MQSCNQPFLFSKRKFPTRGSSVCLHLHRAKTEIMHTFTITGCDMAAKKNRSPTRATRATDAVSMLKADHRQVESWFAQFSRSRSNAKKQALATQICDALTAHTAIEEEIFYPAFLAATADKDLHHEAIVEHDGAKKLIAQIQATNPADEYFDAKVTVLSEMIKHHVKEEEQPGGMFAEAKKSKMDLKALGELMLTRKRELQMRRKAA